MEVNSKSILDNLNFERALEGRAMTIARKIEEIRLAGEEPEMCDPVMLGGIHRVSINKRKVDRPNPDYDEYSWGDETIKVEEWWAVVTFVYYGRYQYEEYRDVEFPLSYFDNNDWEEELRREKSEKDRLQKIVDEVRMEEKQREQEEADRKELERLRKLYPDTLT